MPPSPHHSSCRANRARWTAVTTTTSDSGEPSSPSHPSLFSLLQGCVDDLARYQNGQLSIVGPLGLFNGLFGVSSTNTSSNPHSSPSHSPPLSSPHTPLPSPPQIMCGVFIPLGLVIMVCMNKASYHPNQECIAFYVACIYLKTVQIPQVPILYHTPHDTASH